MKLHKHDWIKVDEFKGTVKWCCSICGKTKLTTRPQCKYLLCLVCNDVYEMVGNTPIRIAESRPVSFNYEKGQDEMGTCPKHKPIKYMAEGHNQFPIQPPIDTEGNAP